MRRMNRWITGMAGKAHRQRGFAFIELLLVLIVLAVLAGWYFREGSTNPHQEAASQYKESINRSNQTACVASRSAMRSIVLTQSMQNPGQPVTKESLVASGVNMNLCPDGGEISVAQDGSLMCSIHQP